MRFLQLFFCLGSFVALLSGVPTGIRCFLSKNLFGFPLIPIAPGVLPTDIVICVAESEKQLLRCHAFLAG